MTRFQASLTVLFLATLTGCPMIGSVETAQTNGEGNFQFAVEPNVWGSAGEGGTIFLPGFNIAGRYGVSDRVDIGARIGSTLGEITAKVMFTDPEADGVRFALAPAVSGIAAGGGGAAAGFFNFKVPLLIGIPVGEYSEFTLGPRLHDMIILGGGGGDSAVLNVVFVGTSVGIAAALSPKVRILPELAVEYPIIASAGTSSGSGGTGFGFGAGVAVWSFNVGFLFGGRD